MAARANHIAFTGPINPEGATPVLTRAQVWAALELKIRSAETFVPNAIKSTRVLSEEVDPDSGNPVTVRDVVFVPGYFKDGEGEKSIRERCVAYEPTKVDFIQPSGTVIHNIISDSENGLLMTYIFGWRHPGASEAELEALAEKERNGARLAVLGSIDSIRKLAKDGKI